MNYSPLRYPGGKAKLTPYIKLIMSRIENPIDTYIEPFASGAGIALDLLLTGAVDKIIINDYDKAIYSFWRAVLEDSKELVTLIKNTEVSVDEWYRQKYVYEKLNTKYSLELGFATFFLNRTNRSGILNAGPIGGYKQNGSYLIDERYNKEKLIDKILKISKLKNNIKLYNKEARPFIEQIVSKYDRNAFVYFDPPYFNKGYRLYKNHLSIQDHLEIAECIRKNVLSEWVITYDDVDEIKNIYADNYYKIYKWAYSIAQKGIKSEIIIFKHKELCPASREIENNIKIKFL